MKEMLTNNQVRFNIYIFGYLGVSVKKKGIIEGWGINDAGYPVTRYEKGNLVWICPIYKDWKHMIVRARSEKFLMKNPAYVGCNICEEWKYFSNFRRWVLEEQPNKDWENCMLDKDLLVLGNKTYSPDTCVYVEELVNQFVKDSAAIRGKYLIGVSRKDGRSKYTSKCRNPFNRLHCYMSYHLTEVKRFGLDQPGRARRWANPARP